MVCMYHLGNQKFTFGNIYKHSYKEIWKSKKRNEVLKFCEKELDHNYHGCQICCRGNEFNKVLSNSIIEINNIPNIKQTLFI